MKFDTEGKKLNAAFDRYPGLRTASARQIKRLAFSQDETMTVERIQRVLEILRNPNLPSEKK